MKRFLATIVCVTLLAGCGRAPVADANPEPSFSGDAPLSGEITVSAYSAMPHKQFLETAAALFEAENPGTKINVDTFASMPEIKTTQTPDGATVTMIVGGDDDDAGASDYVNRITTELMSGAGPDLMATDVLPYYKYAAGGQIEDLNTYINADNTFDLVDYRANILDAVRINGSLYTMPLDYRFFVAGFDPSLFSQSVRDTLQSKDSITYNEMAALAEQGFIGTNGERIFPMIGSDGMVTEIFGIEYGQYADIPNKRVSFDDGRFAGLLEMAKSYEDNGFITPGSFIEQISQGNMSFSLDDIPATGYKSAENMMLMMYLINYHNYAKDGVRKGVLRNGSSLGDTDEIIGAIANADGGVPFTCTQAYAMNANSKNKALAWAFLKFMTGEKAQTSSAMGIGGIPVNNKAAYAHAKMQLASLDSEPAQMAFDGAEPSDEPSQNPLPDDAQAAPSDLGIRPGANQFNVDDFQLTPDQEMVLDDYLQRLDQYSGMLDTFYIKDEAVMSIVSDEIKHYFSGEKTADEAAGVIQNRAGLYLSE